MSVPLLGTMSVPDTRYHVGAREIVQEMFSVCDWTAMLVAHLGGLTVHHTVMHYYYKQVAIENATPLEQVPTDSSRCKRQKRQNGPSAIARRTGYGHGPPHRLRPWPAAPATAMTCRTGYSHGPPHRLQPWPTAPATAMARRTGYSHGPPHRLQLWPANRFRSWGERAIAFGWPMR